MSPDPRLAIVQNLVRIYTDVLHEPVPGDLVMLCARFVERSLKRSQRLLGEAHRPLAQQLPCVAGA